MRSTLMHMNEKVADVDLQPSGITSVYKIYDRELLPVGARKSDISILNTSLAYWQEMRAIPKDRQGIEQILSKIGINSPIEVYMICNAISLTDTYWVKPVERDIKWEDINYHKNPFSETFAKAIYGNNDIEIDVNTPDLTTDGALKKAWVNLEDRKVLLKEGNLGVNGKNHLLSANEVIAYSIAIQCGINAAPYFPVKIKNKEEYICGSECFIKDDNLDFVNALQYLKEGLDGKTLYEKFCSLGQKEKVDQMILFDYLIRNTDRHEKNFGVIRDAHTREIIDFAPLFDNGSCLGWNQEPGKDRNNECKPFKYTFEDQLALVDKVNIELPTYNEMESIIKNVYEKFNVEEAQYNRARLEIICGLRDLQEKEKKKYLIKEEDFEI